MALGLALALTLSAAPALAQDESSVSAEPAQAQPQSATATGGDEIGVDQSGIEDAGVDQTGLVGTGNAQTDAAAGTQATQPPTAAELDFQSIYGGSPYDPVADPSLPSPAQIGGAYDPWERYNRRVHGFNQVIDRRIALPLARAYMNVVPRPIRLGVSNFFSNLGQPVSAVNALLQGKPRQAVESLGRFALNSTLGIGGIFDPASDAKMGNRSEDFGQTLGVWGWERSRFVELPLFGPRTVRDTLGLVGDAPLSPLRQVNEDTVRVGLQGLQLVDVRTQLMSIDSLRMGAEDDYALVRDAWYQRRNYQIYGDRLDEEDEGLPDYLLDDSVPTVPAGAMPVIPGGTN
ncbi:MAG: VacJ family lipoprotein [Pseudomonadota bacterium]|nr:VacJ family lipoprotein [Pseudomonadota bacterium]